MRGIFVLYPNENACFHLKGPWILTTFVRCYFFFKGLNKPCEIFSSHSFKMPKHGDKNLKKGIFFARAKYPGGIQVLFRTSIPDGEKIKTLINNQKYQKDFSWTIVDQSKAPYWSPW